MASFWLTFLLLGRTTALMFHSLAVTKQWDTWAFVENGTWYAYYLITEHGPGEGFGVATSSDAVHWKDHGYVWHGPSWTEHHWWEGTSSVWRAPDYNRTGRYLINYSEYPNGGKQTITFAESYDLIHWSRPPPLNTTYFPIDTAKGYESPGRWDTIYSVPVPGKGQENPRDGRVTGNRTRYLSHTHPLHCQRPVFDPPLGQLPAVRLLDGVTRQRHVGGRDHARRGTVGGPALSGDAPRKCGW